MIATTKQASLLRRWNPLPGLLVCLCIGGPAVLGLPGHAHAHNALGGIPQGGDHNNFATEIKIAEFLLQTFRLKTLSVCLPETLQSQLPPS